MKKNLFLFLFCSVSLIFAQNNDKLVSEKTHFKFFSHTVAEDIEANNYKAVGTLNTDTGDLVFSVPMQSFEFDKAKMQQHYNSPKFLDTKEFPKSKLKGKISDISAVNFSENGEYEVMVSGELNIHGESNDIEEKAIITVNEGQISLSSTFNLTLADYGIAFEDGKPSTNIAKEIKITVIAEY